MKSVVWVLVLDICHNFSQNCFFFNFNNNEHEFISVTPWSH